MCSGVNVPRRPGQVADYDDYVGMEGSPVTSHYVEPTVIEILEAANGLSDPKNLGHWLFPMGYFITPEKLRLLKLNTFLYPVTDPFRKDFSND